jgi:hypothetical protein
MAPNKEIEITEKVKSLYEVMQEEKNVEELEIRSPEFNVHIKRKNNSKPQQTRIARVEEVSIDESYGESKAEGTPSVSGENYKISYYGSFLQISVSYVSYVCK